MGGASVAMTMDDSHVGPFLRSLMSRTWCLHLQCYIVCFLPLCNVVWLGKAAI